MRDEHQEVLKLVQQALKKNPNVSTRALYEQASKAHPWLRKLTLRQFNARCPLQIKRKTAPRGGKTARIRRRAATIDREAVRNVLLSLAEDVAEADGKAQVIKLVANLDSYLDRVEKAVTR